MRITEFRIKQELLNGLSVCRNLILGAALTLALVTPVVANLPELGDPTLGSLSSEDEHQYGLGFYRSLRANLPFIEDLPINYYLTSIGDRLASHSDAAGKQFHFFIIVAPTINAFAGPDAYIGIHTQLILEAGNESQFASVLAHEIAHVSQRHLARAFDSSGNSTVLTIATLIAAILVGSQDAQAGQATLMTGLAASQQTSINFTRSNEQEADRVGIRILTDAGINPQGMVDFFKILLDNSPNGGIEYLRTHPLSVNRVSEAHDRMQKGSEDLPKDSLDFEFTKARLIILLSKQPEKYLTPGILGRGLIPQYQKALAAIRSGVPKLAIKILTKLIKKSRHPWLRLALAEAYTVKQDDKKALNVLIALNKLYPGYLPATMALAKSYNNNNMHDKSIMLLKNQLQTDDYDIIHEELAKAYFANGQISAAQESTGNQYTRLGFIELAIQQYDYALKQEGISTSTKQRLESQKKELQEALQKYKDQH